MSNHAVDDLAVSHQAAYMPDYTAAPGDVLKEHCEAAALTQAELADRLGVSGGHVNRLIAGLEPITPEMARRLESAFGLPAHIWLGMESRYREMKARAAGAAE